MRDLLPQQVITTLRDRYIAAVADAEAKFYSGVADEDSLNEHWFQTLPQARSEIASWRQDYNEVRPHSSLGRMPPAEFAQRHRTKNQPPSASSNEIK